MQYSPRKFEWMRWSIVTVLMLAYLQNYFHRTAPGVLSSDLMATFKTSGASLGALASTYFYVYAAMQVPSGVIADTLGTRVGVTLASIIAGIGSIVFGLAPALAVASAGRLIVGFGVALLFASTVKCHSRWFPARRFATMVGVTVLVGNLGAVLSATPLAALLTLFSWRTVMVGVGISSFAVALLTLLVVRNRPQDLGFPSVHELEGGEPEPEREQHWVHDLWSVLWNKRIWPGFLVNLGLGGGLFAFMGLWGVGFLRDACHVSPNTAPNYMSVMMFACAAGAFFFGWFSDWVGRRKSVLLGGASIYLTAWLALLYLPWQGGILGYCIVAAMGFSGVGILLTNVLAKEVSHPALAGMAVAWVNTGNFLGTALLQPIIGWVLDRTWDGKMADGVRVYSEMDYHNGFLVVIAVTAASLLCVVFLRETYCRNITVSMQTKDAAEIILP